MAQSFGIEKIKPRTLSLIQGRNARVVNRTKAFNRGFPPYSVLNHANFHIFRLSLDPSFATAQQYIGKYSQPDHSRAEKS